MGHCFPPLLGNYRSYLASAVPSAVIPRWKDRAETQSLVWEKRQTLKGILLKKGCPH